MTPLDCSSSIPRASSPSTCSSTSRVWWPRALGARWQELVQQNEQAIGVFNDAVLHYNSAIAQFPASFLAWVFGFKAARGL